jgi:hypothetical protein
MIITLQKVKLSKILTLSLIFGYTKKTNQTGLAIFGAIDGRPNHETRYSLLALFFFSIRFDYHAPDLNPDNFSVFQSLENSCQIFK